MIFSCISCVRHMQNPYQLCLPNECHCVQRQNAEPRLNIEPNPGKTIAVPAQANLHMRTMQKGKPLTCRCRYSLITRVADKKISLIHLIKWLIDTGSTPTCTWYTCKRYQTALPLL